jgi:anti-sigma factor RsiW
MDDLIQKYLDGDLTDEEASMLTRALSEDPELEAELRAYEQSLVLVSENTGREPSFAFTDDVMDRVAAAAAVGKPRSSRSRSGAGASRVWWPRLVWAAGFAAVFVVGFLSARWGGPGTADPESVTNIEPAAEGGQLARVAAAQTIAPAPLRLVRLVYVPPDEDVERVTVAGTFNGWNPEATEMRKEGGAWVLQMVLPPQTYEYMFVEDGTQWVTDPLAMQTRDDGFGQKNAVLDLTL